MHAKRNYSDGYFSIAVAVEVSDVGPRVVCKLFYFHFLSFRRSTFKYFFFEDTKLSYIFFFSFVPPSLRKL